jgi:Xaa-Pro dipeptidase
MRITPATELEYRCSRMQLAMATEGLDAVLIMQNADLFYFTGTVQSGCLYIPAQGQPLYLVRRDTGRARMESGLMEVIPFSSPRDLPTIIAQYGYAPPKRIGMELDVIPVNLFHRYRTQFTDAVWLDAAPLIRRLRMIKSAYEIHIMMDAGRQVDLVYRRAPQVIREGMTDLMLATELEYVARSQGHPGLVRMRSFNGELSIGHVYSGTDSTVPAYTDTPLGGLGVTPSFGQGASYKPIGRHEPIIVDFSGSFDGYLVDQTRIFSLGPVSTRLQKGYEDMLALQELMKDRVKEGAGWGEIYDSCLALAAAQGHADRFMGLPGTQVPFIGHGVGIEIDEYPLIARGFGKTPLEVGMAFAFEPKVLFPGEGAVGIENTFYLSTEGLKQLTVSDERLVIL